MSNKKLKTILLVEDEAITAAMEKIFLEKYGYDVITADTGEKAIEIVESTPFIDLILMDINLGDGIDGTEAAAKILEKHQLPLIFLSSHTDPKVVEKIEKITSYGYIVKDSGETVIIASVRMAFRLFTAKTKEKENTTALSENEANFREIFENSLDNIFVIDVMPGYKFRIKVINNNLAKLIKKNPKEFENKFIDEIFPENISSPLYEKYRHCVDSGKNYCYDEVIELFDKKIYYSTNLVPIFNEDGKIFRIIGISRNITENKLAEEKINNLLHEKELILREVHHRIKNNMNTIFSLITIQANAPENSSAKTILDDAAGRVRSMMILYDKLYCSKDNSTISLKEYLPALVNEIAEIFSKNIPLKIQMQVEDIILGTRVLSPLGIIINELVSNAVKYAFTVCNDSVITVNASKKGNYVLITFKDNGSGLPESISFKNSSGFGLQLVEMLVKQINGSITIERQNGTCFTIKFEI